MAVPGVMLTEHRMGDEQDVHVLRLLPPELGFALPTRRTGFPPTRIGLRPGIGGVIRTVFEHSAGGVVLTADGRLVVVQARNLAGRPVVTLPKGLLEAGEQAIEAARREVTEETGLEVRAADRARAGVVEYWFVRDRVRVKKRVDFFRFTVTGGDPALHDDEVDEVVILEPLAAIGKLTYPAEREVVSKALGL